jgi:probable phosphomutase (TIGR03848 family)
MIKILLIRHALTDSVGKRLSGRMPGVFLNEEGRKQSQELAERLTGLPVTALYSSPLERALETARPIAQSLNLPCIVSDDFIEIDFGKWTNCMIDEIKHDPQFVQFNSFRSSTRIPDGELMSEAQVRIVTGLEKLHAKHPNKTVSVVSHADLIKSAVAYYAGIHLDMFHRLEISPASVSIIEVHDDTARILLLNETGHIGM